MTTIHKLDLSAIRCLRSHSGPHTVSRLRLGVECDGCAQSYTLEEVLAATPTAASNMQYGPRSLARRVSTPSLTVA
jgi:hypothetical protein